MSKSDTLEHLEMYYDTYASYCWTAVGGEFKSFNLKKQIYTEVDLIKR